MKRKYLKALLMMLIILVFSVGTVYAAAPFIPGGDTVLPSVLPDNLDEIEVDQDMIQRAARLPAAPPAANTPSLNGWSSADGELFWNDLSLGGGSLYKIYLNIDGIPGESQDKNNMHQIMLLTYCFGADKSSNSTSTGNTDGFKVLRIFKTTESSSPRLLQALINGDNLQTITIEVVRSGGKSKLGYKLTLDNAVVASFKQNMGGYGCTEEICFNYSGAELTYYLYDSNETLKEEIKANWN